MSVGSQKRIWWNHVMTLKSCVWKWYASFPFIFHWLRKTIWPSLISKRHRCITPLSEDEANILDTIYFRRSELGEELSTIIEFVKMGSRKKIYFWSLMHSELILWLPWIQASGKRRWKSNIQSSCPNCWNPWRCYIPDKWGFEAVPLLKTLRWGE